jgi:hypothetical protein
MPSFSSSIWTLAKMCKVSTKKKVAFAPPFKEVNGNLNIKNYK